MRAVKYCTVHDIQVRATGWLVRHVLVGRFVNQKFRITVITGHTEMFSAVNKFWLN